MSYEDDRTDELEEYAHHKSDKALEEQLEQQLWEERLREENNG